MDSEAFDSELAESEDWAGKATATVVGYVDTVRGATTGKALVASRAAVYFLAAGLIGIMLAILGLIMMVRFLVALTNWAVPFINGGEVWLAYLIIGSLFVFIGWGAWRKKDI